MAAQKKAKTKTSKTPAKQPGLERKDRVIQTRVPHDLETTLKDEARRQRLTVSHLIRNVLEDTFQLVDGVVENVDQIVSDSVQLAKTVQRSAQRLTAAASRDEQAAPGEADALKADAEDLSHVYAWNESVLHQSVICSRCGTEIGRGQKGYSGLSDAHNRERAWLCPNCIEAL
jgi:hypothetical protein